MMPLYHAVAHGLATGAFQNEASAFASLIETLLFREAADSDDQQLLNQLLVGIQKLLRENYGDVLATVKVLDREKLQFQCLYTADDADARDQSYFKLLRDIQFGDSAAGSAIRASESLIVPELKKDRSAFNERVTRDLIDAGIQGIVVHPLHMPESEKVVAVMKVDFRSPSLHDRPHIPSFLKLVSEFLSYGLRLLLESNRNVDNEDQR